MAHDSVDPKRGLTRREAVSWLWEKFGLHYTEGTLAQMASKGTGPVYRLIAGRVAYFDEDLDAWARSRIGPPARSASDARRSHAVGVA